MILAILAILPKSVVLAKKTVVLVVSGIAVNTTVGPPIVSKRSLVKQPRPLYCTAGVLAVLQRDVVAGGWVPGVWVRGVVRTVVLPVVRVRVRVYSHFPLFSTVFDTFRPN